MELSSRRNQHSQNSNRKADIDLLDIWHKETCCIPAVILLNMVSSLAMPLCHPGDTEGTQEQGRLSVSVQTIGPTTVHDTFLSCMLVQ